MNTKLTLKLDKGIIDRAKLYAKDKHTSLSLLVENYFKSISEEREETDIELSPIVQELSGIIELPKDFNLKKEYTNYLIEKYI
ncbi:MAG: hypothetical protein IID16_09225 [Candidatus Marinimicrobia bacterium]|nr:hypothetical protein [Candidatus Neomarinimicrobiota bacterium]